MPPKYEVNERILARNANNKYFFDAKIVSIDKESGEYQVHYQVIFLLIVKLICIGMA